MRTSKIDYEKAKSLIETKVSMENAISHIFGGSLPSSGQKPGMFDCISPSCDGTDTATIYKNRSGQDRCKCFKCELNEDIYNVVMLSLNVKFPEAIRKLCEVGGFEPPTQIVEISEEEAHEWKRRSAIKEIYRLAAEHYQKRLFEPDMAEAQQYLISRDFLSKSISDFKIGACGINELKRAFPDYETNDFLVESGLVVMGADGNRRDALINRIIFPFLNKKGEVVGFSGRLFKEAEIKSEKFPKYKNLTNGPVSEKGRDLFGMGQVTEYLDGFFKDPNNAKNFQKTAIITEGQPCVVKNHFHGFRQTMCAGGNKLTEDHIKVLRNDGFRSVVLCYDADKGGVQGLWKSIKSAAPFLGPYFQISHMSPPGGKDPDEFFTLTAEEKKGDRSAVTAKRAAKRDEFAKCISKARPIQDFLLDLAVSIAAQSKDIRQFEKEDRPEILSAALKEVKSVLALFEDDEYMHAVSLSIEKKAGMEPGSLSKGARALRDTGLTKTSSHIDSVKHDSTLASSSTLLLGAMIINDGYSEDLDNMFEQVRQINPNDEDVIFVKRLLDIHREKANVSVIELIERFNVDEQRDKVKRCIDYVLSAPSKEENVWAKKTEIAAAAKLEMATRRQTYLGNKVNDGKSLSPEEASELVELSEIKRESRRLRASGSPIKNENSPARSFF